MRPTSALRRLALAILWSVAAAAPVFAQAPTAQQAPTGDEKLLAAMHSISSHTLYDYVAEMASPKYEGRLTGTPA